MNIDNSASVAPTKNGHSTKYFLYMILGVLILTASSWIFFGKDTLLNLINSSSKLLSPPVVVVAETDIKFDNSEESLGMLYLTLALPHHNFPGPYTFDVKKRELLASGYPTVYTIYNDFSSDGSLHAFVGTTQKDLDAASGNYDKALQVYISPANTTNAYPDQQTVSKITNTNVPLKREVSINNDGKVLFSARGNLVSTEDITGGELAKASDWSIYLTSSNSKTRFLTNGIHPKWIDNKSFIYLGQNGIYSYNIEDGFSVQLISVKRDILSNNKFDLSDDASTIAWSDPDAGKVYIFKVADWTITLPKLPQIKHVGDINTHAFWVAISPDSLTIAVQAVDWSTLKTAPNPRIEFYSLDTLTKKYKDYSLKSFEQSRMFLTDWR